MSKLRSWIAVALLAGSWIFGLNYFYPAEYGVWALLLAAAVVLLYGTAVRLPSHREMWFAVLLLLPAAIWTPRPYTVIPICLLLGLLLQFAPISLQRLKTLGQGFMAAGGILLVQALVLAVYTAQTMRSHELIWPLPNLLAAVARLFSIDAAFDGVNIVFRTMRQTHRLAPTWELLFDPVSVCLLVGGMFFLGLKCARDLPPGKRWSGWIRSLRIFTLIVLVWLPIRAGLLMAIYVNRVLTFDPERSLYVMNHFFAPWPLLLLAFVPMLLAWRFVRFVTPENSPLPLEEGPGVRAESNTPTAWRYFAALLLCAAAVAIYTAAIEWSPLGARKGGRVKVVERHSTWEPTEKPYDTTSYGEEAGYNYAALYDYLGQYYDMTRIRKNDRIDEATLESCDVLIIKTPTERYAKEEVEAVLKFVRRGGGVLFIGDHTNLYRMGTVMNDMTRPMGFIFRDDLLFSNERTEIRTLAKANADAAMQAEPEAAQDEPTSPTERTCYHQFFAPPWPQHPALQHIPPMEFAVSCSIDPGSSHGRAVIANTGLWSMPPDYHMENYHPIPQHVAAMRYGAFVQLWATYFGNGRAMAFTDSTIFSNFCAYQPGHAELLRDMVEWLNHENPPLDPRPWLSFLGTIVLAVGVWLVLRSGYREGTGVCFLAAGMAGWIGACGLVAVLHRANLPLPEAKKPLPRVVIDRTTSTVPLSQGPYRKGENGSGYGLLEQWMAKLNCYTIREEGEASFSGDVLAVLCPTRAVSENFRTELVRYVENGGKLVVFDSPENSASTANDLLAPFKIEIHRANPLQGSLIVKHQWPNIPAEKACEVSGGEPIARVDGKAVAATTHYGKGTVMAVGFGALFNDRHMGYNWMIDPDKAVKQRFDVFYALFRSVLRNRPIEPTQEATGSAMEAETSSKPSENNIKRSPPPLDLPELPTQEKGPGE